MYPKMDRKQHYDSTPKTHETNIAIVINPYTRLQSIFSHLKWREKEHKNAYDLINFR